MLKLEPNHPFSGLENCTIKDFWSWAYSDIMANTIRPLIAEFLVGHALGIIESPRLEWDAVDLRYENWKIEVKSAAYIQTWKQKKPSIIRYDIAAKKGWDACTNISSDKCERTADIYVFCLLDEKDKEKADPLDISQWKFYVIRTDELESLWGNQKNIALSILSEAVEPINYSELKSVINAKLRE